MNPGTDVPPVRCQALRRVRGVIERCPCTAVTVSAEPAGVPRLVCVHHRRRAPRGYVDLTAALAELPAPLFDAYLARLAQARDECQHLLARYQAQARTLAALLAAAEAEAARLRALAQAPADLRDAA